MIFSIFSTRLVHSVVYICRITNYHINKDSKIKMVLNFLFTQMPKFY